MRMFSNHLFVWIGLGFFIYMRRFRLRVVRWLILRFRTLGVGLLDIIRVKLLSFIGDYL